MQNCLTSVSAGRVTLKPDVVAICSRRSYIIEGIMGRDPVAMARSAGRAGRLHAATSQPPSAVRSVCGDELRTSLFDCYDHLTPYRKSRAPAALLTRSPPPLEQGHRPVATGRE